MKNTVLTVAAALIIGSATTATATTLVTGSQIADGTIDIADLDPSVLGVNTPMRKVTLPAYNESDADAGRTLVVVRCPSGTRAINGGLRADETGSAVIDVSFPTRSGWALEVQNIDPADEDNITAFAVCL